ncbi:MAG: ankyrin repeat domain-containing protein [Alphaproteobacteria bacterium]|nr:ankyrin repeat domain-containing protein [Alphaproteobacteria bacterium]
MNIDIITSGTNWGVMHFKLIAYLILLYTGLSIVSAIYIFLVVCDWLKHKCLINYVQTDSMQGFECILKTGVDINERNIFGKTPLMGVVRYAKDAKMLEKIVQQADVNLQDESGNTPLMEAARYNTNEQISEVLIYAGANVHAVNKSGENALMIAATYNTNPAIIMMLINAGTNINATDENTKTALMYAAQFNPNPQIIDVLLQMGADKTMRNENGRTAYDFAHENMELYQTQQYRALEI